MFLRLEIYNSELESLTVFTSQNEGKNQNQNHEAYLNLEIGNERLTSKGGWESISHS